MIAFNIRLLIHRWLMHIYRKYYLYNFEVINNLKHKKLCKFFWIWNSKNLIYYYLTFKIPIWLWKDRLYMFVHRKDGHKNDKVLNLRSIAYTRKKSHRPPIRSQYKQRTIDATKSISIKMTILRVKVDK